MSNRAYNRQYNKQRRARLLAAFGNKCALCEEPIQPRQRYVIHHIWYELYKREVEEFGHRIKPSGKPRYVLDNIDGFCLMHWTCHKLFHLILDTCFKFKWCSVDTLFKNIIALIKKSKFSKEWEEMKCAMKLF